MLINDVMIFLLSTTKKKSQIIEKRENSKQGVFQIENYILISFNSISKYDSNDVPENVIM